MVVTTTAALPCRTHTGLQACVALLADSLLSEFLLRPQPSPADAGEGVKIKILANKTKLRHLK